jgi:hypothetical protein
VAGFWKGLGSLGRGLGEERGLSGLGRGCLFICFFLLILVGDSFLVLGDEMVIVDDVVHMMG